jgi:uroporphyrinogen decarboxylase
MKFIAAVYEHAARLIDRTPWEVSRDSELLFQAHAEAFRRYSHSPIVPSIDIYNVEAEDYGARVEDTGGIGVPLIKHPLCENAADLVHLPPLDTTRGRVREVLEVAGRLRSGLPAAHVAIPLSGPFSIASQLLGFEKLLTSVLVDEAALRNGLAYLLENQMRVCGEIVRAGFDVIIFDSAAGPPLLSAQDFHNLIHPTLQRLVAEAKRLFSTPVSLIVGGNTSTVVDDLVATGADHLLCPAETDQTVFMQRMRAYPGPEVRINMSPAVFSGENDEMAMAEASRAVALGQERPGTCVGSGVLAYDAVPEMVCKIRDFVEGCEEISG